jgi:hypothetical protein
VRPPGLSVSSSYRLRVSSTRIAEIKYTSGHAELVLNEKILCRTGSTVRLISDLEGKFQSAVGIAPRTTSVVLWHPSDRKRTFSIAPNSSVSLKSM